MAMVVEKVVQVPQMPVMGLEAVAIGALVRALGLLAMAIGLLVLAMGLVAVAMDLIHMALLQVLVKVTALVVQVMREAVAQGPPRATTSWAAPVLAMGLQAATMDLAHIPLVGMVLLAVAAVVQAEMAMVLEKVAQVPQVLVMGQEEAAFGAPVRVLGLLATAIGAQSVGVPVLVVGYLAMAMDRIQLLQVLLKVTVLVVQFVKEAVAKGPARAATA